MARAFVLIDALPRKEQLVFDSLGKMPAVVSKRMLPQRVGQGDIIALVEATDHDEVERFITNQLRSLNFVHNIIRVQPHQTLLGGVHKLMEEMYKEADARHKV